MLCKTSWQGCTRRWTSCARSEIYINQPWNEMRAWVYISKPVKTRQGPRPSLQWLWLKAPKKPGWRKVDRVPSVPLGLFLSPRHRVPWILKTFHRSCHCEPSATVWKSYHKHNIRRQQRNCILRCNQLDSYQTLTMTSSIFSQTLKAQSLATLISPNCLKTAWGRPAIYLRRVNHKSS